MRKVAVQPAPRMSKSTALDDESCMLPVDDVRPKLETSDERRVAAAAAAAEAGASRGRHEESMQPDRPLAETDMLCTR